jgi:hypothetical protein
LISRRKSKKWATWWKRLNFQLTWKKVSGAMASIPLGIIFTTPINPFSMRPKRSNFYNNSQTN